MKNKYVVLAAGGSSLVFLAIWGIYQLLGVVPYRSDLQIIATFLVIAVIAFPIAAWFGGYRAGRQEGEGVKAGLELALNAKPLSKLGSEKQTQVPTTENAIPWDVNNPPGAEGLLLPAGQGQGQLAPTPPKIIMSEQTQQILDL